MLEKLSLSPFQPSHLRHFLVSTEGSWWVEGDQRAYNVMMMMRQMKQVYSLLQVKTGVSRYV